MLKDLNKDYWKQVPSHKTTSVDILPGDDVLSRIPQPSRVLDIGCGEGKLSEWFSGKGHHVSAIDINPNVIDANIKLGTKVEYSIQDITSKTSYRDGTFNLVCSKFTLANIHSEEWDLFRKEIKRIISPKGFVWIVEPLVSEDYSERYELAKLLFKDEHTIFVFKDPDMAKTVHTIKQLENAISQGKVSRISVHYTREALLDLFIGFDVVTENVLEINSPSGYKINTFVGLLQKRSEN